MLKVRAAKSCELPLLAKWSRSKRNRDINFSICLESDCTRKLIVSEGGKPIGVVVFDRHEGEMSIFLVPRHHDKGKGNDVLFMAHEWIRRYYPNIGYLWADCGNTASIRLFEGMGYVRELCGDWIYDF